MDWKTFAAFWGAGLATWLAFVRILPDRPRLHVEPRGKGQIGDAIVRVANPSKRPVFMREWCRLRLTGDGPRDLALFFQTARINDVSMLVRPQSEMIFEVMFSDTPSSWLVIFRWQHPWLLPLWLPACLVLSSARAARDASAARDTGPVEDDD